MAGTHFHEKYEVNHIITVYSADMSIQIQIQILQATLKSLIKFLTDQEKEAGFVHTGRLCCCDDHLSLLLLFL